MTKLRYTTRVFGMESQHRTITAAYSRMTHTARSYGASDPEHYGIRDNRADKWLTAEELTAALKLAEVTA